MASTPSCDEEVQLPENVGLDYTYTCASSCFKWTHEDLVKVVSNNGKPDWWMGEYQVCYRLVNELFETSVHCECGGSQAEIVARALLAIEPNLTVPAHPKNLKRKAVNFVKKKHHGCVTASELYFKSKEPCDELVGQECGKNSITMTVLKDIVKHGASEDDSIKYMKLDCGAISQNHKMILELNDNRQRMSASWNNFVLWLIVLSWENGSNMQDHSLDPSSCRSSVERLVKKQKELSRKRKGKDKVCHNAKRKKDAGHDQNNVPAISNPDDLIGKKVAHYCYGDDGNCRWFDGTVIGTHGKNVKESDYLIRYDGFEDMYIFAHADWTNGEVKLLSLPAEDFLGRYISQRFEDENHETSWWESDRVLNVENTSGSEMEFVVEFDGQGSEEEISDDIPVECELCIFNLLEEYMNNDLRFI